jgi:hypothetical protein
MDIRFDKKTTRRGALRGLGLTAASLATVGVLNRNTEAQSGPGQDANVLNFALNLEYLEAEYYTYATTGNSIEAQGIAVNGAGTPGGVTVKPNPVVPFSTAAYQQYALEIAADEQAHVKFIRSTLLALGVQPVARPAIDLQNSFTAAARAAGIVGPTETFDPFANEVSFLLGAFIFEDVGVTAFKGAARLLTNKDILENAAGILAVEAYHAGNIRNAIFELGATAQGIAQKISDLRDAVDGSDDRDQGVTSNTAGGGSANIVPTDANGVAYSRTTRQVLNIVYLAANASSGGFYPNGLNGAIH